MSRIELTELERQKLAKAGADSISGQHEWRPIDTAPDDGTPILAYYHGEIYSISHHAGGIIYLNHPNESDMQILIKTEFEWWAYMPDVDHL